MQHVIKPEQWRDEFGPLQRDQLNEFAYHLLTIEGDAGDPGRQLIRLRRYGYRNLSHFVRVKFSFYKHHGAPTTAGGELDFFALTTPRGMRALERAEHRRRWERIHRVVARHPELIAAVEEVTLEMVALLEALHRRVSEIEFQRVLRRHKMTLKRFQRIATVWHARMERDTTGILNVLYGQALVGDEVKAILRLRHERAVKTGASQG